MLDKQVSVELIDSQLSRLQKRMANKVASRRFVRICLLTANLALLAGVFIFISSNSNALQNQTLVASAELASTNSASATNPLDQLSAADIAANVANVTNLPEATAVTNQADSVSSDLTIAPVTNTVIAQPQVVATNFKSRFDIQTYIVKAGDNVASIASKFNVTSSSIQWSNGLTGNNVSVGTKLLIPPVDGIVYTVKQGDSAQTLAQKYNSNAEQITAFNDTELTGLQVGMQIVIPDGQPPAQQGVGGGGAGALFGAVSGSLAASYGGFGGCVYNGVQYSNYGYDCGFCTWWAAFQRAMHGDPVPSNLGEAYSWAYNAAAMGIPEGNTPKPGAVITFGSGDHVAYVVSVGSDGSATISEMNRAGWDIVDTRTLPPSQADSYTYIY